MLLKAFIGRKEVFAIIALSLVKLCDASQLAMQPSHQQEASICSSPESNQIWLVCFECSWQKVRPITFSKLVSFFQMFFTRWINKINPRNLRNVPSGTPDTIFCLKILYFLKTFFLFLLITKSNNRLNHGFKAFTLYSHLPSCVSRISHKCSLLFCQESLKIFQPDITAPFQTMFALFS